jgi:hypothetical protein
LRYNKKKLAFFRMTKVLQIILAFGFISLFFILFSCSHDYSIQPNRILFPFFSSDFENNNYIGWYEFERPDYSFQITFNNSTTGTKCSKIILPANQTQVEMVKTRCAYNKTEMIYTWAFKLDAQFTEHPSQWTIIHQFHDYPDFRNGKTWKSLQGHRPPIATLYLNGEIKIRLSTSNSESVEIGSVNIKKGDWNIIQQHIYWAMDDRGFIQVKVNDKVITKSNNTDGYYHFPTLYNLEGNYFKTGLYRQFVLEKANIIYMDDFRFFSVR